MCWRSDKVEYQKKKIADEDIEVFKIVQNICGDYFSSIYQGFRYDIGNEYEQEMETGNVINTSITSEEYISQILIHRGLHSYSSKDVGINPAGKNMEYLCITSIRKNHVIDSFLIEEYANMYKLNCIIPKGSEYYENELGEIVSNKIKVISSEEIDLNVINTKTVLEI